MSASPHHYDFDSSWMKQLGVFADTIREAALRELHGKLRKNAAPRPVSVGAGDVTYALDRATETALFESFVELSRAEPLSLFTEDAGWRHRGPDGSGESMELPGFDHGGPRIVIDPVDGTRNLMADLRSAWTVSALCPPGAGEPRLSDVVLGHVSELPDSRAARYRVLRAARGHGARFASCDLESGQPQTATDLRADDDERADHGYFSFFRYTPAMRPLIADIEASFFAALAQFEGADIRHCFDDQYISNGGQLALLSLGTYRFIADIRSALAKHVTSPCTTSKPYDSAGALLVAREAGCVVTAADGGELDFPLDATTPVSFVGFANAGTQRRLAPHLARSLNAALSKVS